MKTNASATRSAIIAVLVAVLTSIAGQAQTNAAPSNDADSVQLPRGAYVPFYASESNKQTPGRPFAFHRLIAVEAFRLDRDPVTNGEFLAFVRENRQWRRSQIQPIFADRHYLAQWSSDLALRDTSDAERPVTNVSWFAAEAYCRVQGKMLPTTDQWEYALADQGRDARGLRDRILAWYAEPGGGKIPSIQTARVNSYGVRGLDGLVWEWTLDFNSLMSGPDLRGGDQQFCGGGSLGASDPSDYASFMRYSMRASLKAAYTTNSLGFRCATNGL